MRIRLAKSLLHFQSSYVGRIVVFIDHDLMQHFNRFLHLFCLHAPYQFTLLLNLRSLIFPLTSFGWLATAVCSLYEHHDDTRSRGEEKLTRR